jgi:MFS family permease
MGLGRNYRKLWLAAAISNVGDGVALTAFPLLATRLTRDPVLIANVAVLERLPWVLFTLVSGALADRFDRRALMARVDAFRGLLLVVIAAAVLWHRMTLPLLYVVVFLLGTAETLFDNAAQAIMPMIVERDQLQTANSRLYGVQIVTTQFVGPPAGSFLFAAAASVPFFIDGASFFGGALIVALMAGAFRPAPATEGARPPLRKDIAEGVRWLWRNKLLRTMAFSLGTFNLLWNGAFSIIVLFALEELHLKPAAYGLLLAAGAAGSLAGSFAARKISRALGGGRTLVLVGLSAGISMLVLSRLSNAWIAGALFALDAFGGIVWNVITVSLRQSVIPEHLMGRVNSVYRMIGWGSIPVGAAIGGVVAKSFGLRAPFTAAGIAMIVATLLLFRLMIPGIREIESNG